MWDSSKQLQLHLSPSSSSRVAVVSRLDRLRLLTAVSLSLGSLVEVCQGPLQKSGRLVCDACLQNVMSQLSCEADFTDPRTYILSTSSILIVPQKSLEVLATSSWLDIIGGFCCVAATHSTTGNLRCLGYAAMTTLQSVRCFK